MKLMDYYSSGEHLLIHADKTKFILLYPLAHCLHHCKNPNILVIFVLPAHTVSPLR